MNDLPPTGSVAISTVLGTFFPEGGQPIGQSDKAQFAVASKWQELGGGAPFGEVHGVFGGMPHGYMTELLGRAAAAGEQVGLSLTLIRDAEFWRDLAIDTRSESRRAIAGRALAESSGLWAVSTGHAVVNVVARVIRAHKWSVYIDKKLGWDGPPAPFADAPGSNLSLNGDTVKTLARAARETGETPLLELVQPLRDLLQQPEWKALALRRDTGYHRWRPQSIDGGVPNTNPWVDEGNGSLTLSVGISSGYVPPALEPLVAEARAGHDSLSLAMSEIFTRLPKAMTSSGIGMWQT